MIHVAVDSAILNGCYVFDFLAYKRSLPLDKRKREYRDSKYAFVLFLNQRIKENEDLEKCDNEKHIFDIETYIQS